MAETIIMKEKAPVTATVVESSEKDDEVQKAVVVTPPEVVLVKCECCSFIEECTMEYIACVRERNEGRWICGLCAQAVKDEIGRSGRRISKKEAWNVTPASVRSFDLRQRRQCSNYSA